MKLLLRVYKQLLHIRSRTLGASLQCKRSRFMQVHARVDSLLQLLSLCECNVFYDGDDGDGGESINPSIHQSINQSIKSINSSINQSINQSMKQATDQSIGQSISQAINQAMMTDDGVDGDDDD